MVINSLSYLLPTTNALLYSLVNSIIYRRANAHGGHHVEHTILTDDISTLFAEALNKFEPITSQPTDSHLAELRKMLPQILLIITYDKKNRIHNLVGIIQDPTTYTADYTAAFPYPSKPAFYDAPIREIELEPLRP